ncbi:MAG: hypothetical protein PHC51_10575 [bacterium]|nr:hypothetical protein [bacterium]
MKEAKLNVAAEKSQSTEVLKDLKLPDLPGSNPDKEPLKQNSAKSAVDSQTKAEASLTGVEKEQQHVRNGKKLVRLGADKHTELAKSVQNDLKAWAEKKGVELQLDSDGAIGDAAVRQFQREWKKEHPEVKWASREDGVVGLRTMRQLDLELGRKEQLAEKGLWMDDNQFAGALNRGMLTYYTQSREGLQELVSKIGTEKKYSKEQMDKLLSDISSMNIDALYEAFSYAETGSMKDPFIRTLAGEGTSSAYGPVQITRNLARDIRDKGGYAGLPPEVQQYADAFISQGDRMLKASNDDPVFGLGKKGVLGDEKFHDHYEMFAKATLAHELKGAKNNYHGDDPSVLLDQVIRRWRGVGEGADPRYFAKVRGAMVEQLANG